MNGNNNSAWSRPDIAYYPGLESLRVITVAQFLPVAERDALFDAVCASREAFQHPDNPDSGAGGSLYLSLESGRPDLPGAGPVREACGCLATRIQDLLPDLFTGLGVAPFAVTEVPLSFVNGLDGHSGSPHADESGDRFRVSLLYYFYRSPKAFRGGDLQFYDGDSNSANGYGDEPVATIDLDDNLLVAFPSHVFHGISDVVCDSTDFEDGRFAAIGFLGPR